MKNFPIRIPNSAIHFALRGRLKSGFALLATSENCPLTLYDATPTNSAGKLSGHLKRTTLINIIMPNYNWVYSETLPKFEPHPEVPSGDQREQTEEHEGIGNIEFQVESRLQFAWKAYSTSHLRSRVQKQLDRQRMDLCKAILAYHELSLAEALAPILLQCEGYSIGEQI